MNITEAVKHLVEIGYKPATTTADKARLQCAILTVVAELDPLDDIPMEVFEALGPDLRKVAMQGFITIVASADQ